MNKRLTNRLTDRQLEALTYLTGYQRKHRRFPLRRVMAKDMGISKTTAQNLIDGLVRRKAIFRLPGRGNSLNGCHRLAFEPFDPEEIILETPPPKAPPPKMPKVTIFLSPEGIFRKYEFTLPVQVIIKRSEA